MPPDTPPGNTGTKASLAQETRSAPTQMRGGACCKTTCKEDVRQSSYTPLTTSRGASSLSSKIR